MSKPKKEVVGCSHEWGGIFAELVKSSFWKDEYAWFQECDSCGYVRRIT